MCIIIIIIITTKINNRLSTCSDEYHHQEAMKYDSLVLMCNTSNSPGVVWTLNATKIPTEDWEFNYVYVNGSIVDHEQFLITYSIVDSTNLKITNADPVDSGFYDCYETNGEQIVGYYLDVKGMLPLSSSSS